MMMRRRRFLEGCGYGPGRVCWRPRPGCRAAPSAGAAGREIAADVVIVGGGLGGCAAALAALRAGRTVVLTEPTDWIGGQLTSQAVPPDEHPWIEQFGANASYRELRQGIRDYYRRHYPLTAEARAARSLQPRQRRRLEALPRAEGRAGGADGHARTLCVQRPAADACSSTSRSRPKCRATGSAPSTVRDRRTGRERSLAAPYFLDATELGDLLPMAGVEFVDRRRGPGPHRRAARRRAPTSPTTSRRSPAASPSSTSTARTTPSTGPPSTPSGATSSPRSSPPWPGRLLDLTYSDPITLKPASRGFDPRGAGAGLWVYRRILDPRNFQPGSLSRQLGDHAGQLAAERLLARPDRRRPGSRPSDAQRHIARAKQLSLSLLYWLQTECPRPDGKLGWKGLKLRPDLVGTDDGLAKAPYIRESRRILAEFTVLEQHVGTEARRSKTEGAGRPRPSRSRTASASAATGSTCTPAPAATTTSTSARCRSRSRSAP